MGSTSMQGDLQKNIDFLEEQMRELYHLFPYKKGCPCGICAENQFNAIEAWGKDLSQLSYEVVETAQIGFMNMHPDIVLKEVTEEDMLFDNMD